MSIFFPSLVSRHLGKHFLLVLKVAGTAGFLGWIAAHADAAALWRAWREVGALAIGAAAALNAASFVAGGARWWLLLQHALPRVPFRSALPSYYLGIFLNNVLPTGVGGDVARTVHMRWRGFGLPALVASALMDRMVGVCVVLWAGAWCAWASPDIPRDSTLQAYLIGAGVSLAAAAGLWFSPLPKRVLAYVGGHAARHSAIAALLEIARHCTDYPARTLAWAAVYSLAVQALMILAYYVLGRALGLDVSLLTYFAIVPIVLLATVLPVSLGGLGVREGVLAGLLWSLGVDVQRAITLSLLFLAVLWLSSLPGLTVMFLRTARADAKPVADAAG